MLKRLIPREERFFDLFEQLGALTVKGAEEFKELLLHLDQAESRSRAIKAIEHDADEVTHQTLELLHKTFITPLDRADIHQLVTRLDDIIDFIEAASQRISLYNITVIPPRVTELAEICYVSATHIRAAVNGLERLQNPTEILKHCVEVNRLENEADHILRSAMVQLFRDEPDTRQLIKVKEIYEILEAVTDRCEDVANIIEGILLEYA